MTGHVYPIPPCKYAGVERVVYWWINELRRRGNKVFLVGDTGSTVEVDGFVQKTMVSGDAFVSGISRLSKECDVVHDNNDCHSPSQDRWRIPYIYTVHAMVWNGNPNPVFLSYNQARYFKKDNPFVANNGFPIDDYEYSDEKEDYYLWCGAIRGCKGPEMAIAACNAAKVKIKVIGPIQDGAYSYLLDNEKRGDYVEYLGEMGIERLEVFRKAKGFIYTFSDSWVEGFNLTNIEALLSGTPVIGRRTELNRIVDEQIDTRSGVSFETTDELIEILKNNVVSDISPVDCRLRGEFFDVRRTVDRYVEAYELVMKGCKL